MLLAIDIGNTITHFGIFPLNTKVKRNTRPVKYWSVKTKDLKNVKLHKNLFSRAVLGSVVPKAIPIIKNKLKVPTRVVTCKIDLGLKIKYKKPCDVGIDRLADAVAAKYLYDYPAFVIDYGTAVTIDVISKQGDYLGGVILPGIEMIRQGLEEKTALLPLVSIGKPRKILGQTTQDAIKSGIYYGIKGMILQLLTDLKKELHLPAKTVIICTGGNAELLGKDIGIVDNFLTLKGLKIIYERNKIL